MRVEGGRGWDGVGVERVNHGRELFGGKGGLVSEKIGE